MLANDVQHHYIEDRDGNRITEAMFQGRYYPAFPGVVERLERLPELRARGDDIVICAYPKSGTHWTWEIVTMLMIGKAETIPQEKTEQFLENVDQETLESQPSPRVLNTHILPDIYPPDLVRKKCKILRIQRNPKDVMVSYYHHIKDRVMYGYEHGKWPAFFELCMSGNVEYGSWFDYVIAWKKFEDENPDVPILHLQYENMIKDLSTAVEKIAGFLNVTADKSLCDAIAHACTFDNMKQSKAECYPKEKLERWYKKEYNLYRKGIVGDWKNWFTDAQNEEFEKEFKRRLQEAGISTKVE